MLPNHDEKSFQKEYDCEELVPIQSTIHITGIYNMQKILPISMGKNRQLTNYRLVSTSKIDTFWRSSIDVYLSLKIVLFCILLYMSNQTYLLIFQTHSRHFQKLLVLYCVYLRLIDNIICLRQMFLLVANLKMQDHRWSKLLFLEKYVEAQLTLQGQVSYIKCHLSMFGVLPYLCPFCDDFQKLVDLSQIPDLAMCIVCRNELCWYKLICTSQKLNQEHIQC